MNDVIRVADNQKFELDECEIAENIFFSQLNEPTFTINGNKITANTAAVRLLGDADYVKILINRKSKILALKPCSDYDLHGYNWVKVKNGKRYPKHRTGLLFVLSLCQMMDWNPNFRYKAIGRRLSDEEETILAFDLLSAQPYRKKVTREWNAKAVVPRDWNGSFGPKYREYTRTLQVNRFMGFNIMSVSDGSVHAINDCAAQRETGGLL